MRSQVAGDGDRGETGQEASLVLNPKEGETFTIGSMLVTIKAAGADTGNRFTLIEITIPPYFADISTHLHQRRSEAIYLTHGMLAVTLGEETMVVRQGSFILIPPEQPHRLWNPAATQATFLTYFTPAGMEGFFEALAEMALPEGGTPPDKVVEIWALGAQYDHFPVPPAGSATGASSEPAP